MLSFRFAHQPRMCGYYKKKVWGRLVYLNEGCGMTRTQINNTPHPYLGIGQRKCHNTKYTVTSVLLSLCSENFHIFVQGQKLIHFHQNMSAIRGLHYKFRNLFLKEQKSRQNRWQWITSNNNRSLWSLNDIWMTKADSPFSCRRLRLPLRAQPECH